MMETLENKLDRLSAEQRREVEDFVDFLIQRAEGIRVTVQLAPHDAPSTKSAAPPLIISDPVPQEDHGHEISEPAIGHDANSENEPLGKVHEISEPDGSADGFFDYGRFEKSQSNAQPSPSPADAAVQKVKKKLIEKSEQESKNLLLDWID